MEQLKCVCGAAMQYVKGAQSNGGDLFICSQHGCGAEGRSYAGALRRRIRLELSKVRDLRRAAAALLN